MNQPEVVPVREKAPPRLFPAIAKGNVSLVKAKKRKKGKKAKTTNLGPSGVVYERRFMLEYVQPGPFPLRLPSIPTHFTCNK